VVERLLRLIRFRNQHPAFGGGFRVLNSGENELALEWRLGSGSTTESGPQKSMTPRGADTAGSESCRLEVNLAERQARITYSDDAGRTVEYRP
jgi:sucrose phosphorylase